MGERGRPKIKKICVECGNEFIPRSGKQVTCSENCSKQRELKKKREWGRNRMGKEYQPHEMDINMLIPKAVQFANKRVPDWKRDENKMAKWNSVYFQKMNELTINAGLRREVMPCNI